ncbi:MAG: TMAO reductase system periplasmic protein TorT [Desulfobacteraceae bacterium]|nr:TMAO reductase system periplasmic protein TorT [Desulfobacteraceae bacterium]
MLINSLPAYAELKWYPFPVDVWTEPFKMESSRVKFDYVPLKKSSKKWRISVFFPHMKDSYWLAVNYGVAFEAKRIGVRMDLYQAGGYDSLDIQLAQIKESVAAGTDGVIIGAISYDGINALVNKIRARGIPVIDLVNGMSTNIVSAKSLVSFGEMGFKAGEYIARMHPKKGKKIKVAWFPGPKDAGWVKAGDRGFKKAVADSVIEVVATRYGDTGKKVQSLLLNEVLNTYSDIDYIVGTAVTAEAAVKVLRKLGLEKRIKIMAYYLTPGVYRGIKRGKILAAPTDSAVIQGRIAIDQIVRILEKEKYLKHVGPRLYVIDKTNVDTFDRSTVLAPKGFRATYTVN